MIVDPWGQILDRVSDAGPGLAVAEIDRKIQQQVRDRFPSLQHRRFQIATP
jgi:predicted amidohydrolase